MDIGLGDVQMGMRLFDTHTHFDDAIYDAARTSFVGRALAASVTDVVLIGVLASGFSRMLQVASDIHQIHLPHLPYTNMRAHLAMGLHPLYIVQHQDADLMYLDTCLHHHANVAVAEIGLDTYPKALRQPEIYARQQRFFYEQLRLACSYDLPVLLHIRKAHSDVLAILKQAKYNAHNQGGIAHSFSGGEQEALAFVRAGFKLGVTGQVTNPNAKKLHRAITAVVAKHGVEALVIESDCPDMMPMACQSTGTVNEPANLPQVLQALALLTQMPTDLLAERLWHNSLQALRLTKDSEC